MESTGALGAAVVEDDMRWMREEATHRMGKEAAVEEEVVSASKSTTALDQRICYMGNCGEDEDEGEEEETLLSTSYSR